MTATLEKPNGHNGPNGHSTGRVGRPRANPRPLSRPPEEEILVAAGRLFAEKGFTATSTREIAEAAGLRQPSLFHYYPKKEKILERLLRRVGELTLEYARQLDLVDAPASAKLYRLMFFDVYQMASAPYPSHALMYLPEVRPPNFPTFWENEGQISQLFADLVRRAIAEGDFAPTDPELSAVAVRGMGTGTATWLWRRNGQGPEELAHHVASLQLRSLLATPEALGRVRASASALRM